MKIMRINILILPCLLWLMMACNSGPKVIEGEATATAFSPNSLPSLQQTKTQEAMPPSNDNAVYQVVVEEILSTEKYNYLHVREKDQQYWIAISRSDVELGDTYFYRGGLLKRNFFSREFNRVFETVYLVSEIWSASLKEKQAMSSSPHMQMPTMEVGKIELVGGAISLDELFSNQEKYEGKTVRVTGKCVKVNPMIMNRNWLHIQDGSGDKLDLTVTTNENVHLGAVVTLAGTLTLNKDFGAGYRYDIILEEAVVIQ